MINLLISEINMKKIIFCLFAIIFIAVISAGCMRIAHNTVVVQQEEKGEGKPATNK